MDSQPVWGLLSARGTVRGTGPTQAQGPLRGQQPSAGAGGDCNPAALSGICFQRPVSAGTMPALWAPLPAGSGGREGGPHCHTASNSRQTVATTVRLQGPHVTSCPLGAAERAGPGRGPGRPRQQVAQISTPSPAGTGTPPASAGVAWGQRRGQGPQG